MRGLRKLLLGSAAAALAITALGAAPASAADTEGSIAMVNGYPNVRVDVCVGNKEKRSGMAYGKYYHMKYISNGPKVIKFYQYNPSKKCGGKLLGRKWVNITPGWDRTLVLTKKDPKKVVVFDNVSPFFLGEIPPLGTPHSAAWGAVRSAADFLVDIDGEYWNYAGHYSFPSATTSTYEKGDQFASGFTSQYVWVTNAYTVGETEPFASSNPKIVVASKRYEWILVGTWQGNAKWVIVKRSASQVSP